MANTTQPPLTDEQNERLLKLAWADLLLQLSDERAVAAQATLEECLQDFNDFPDGTSLARYRCAIIASNLSYWQAILDGYIPLTSRF